jgi:hypothetical protein
MNAIAEPAPLAAWPACRDAMHRTALTLLDSNATDDDAAHSLLRDFGADLPGKWSEEVRMTLCRSVVAEEACRLSGERASARRQSDPVVTPMSPGLVAFAEARGLVCAYCGRAGARSADPDGRNWYRDSVPKGFQRDGRDLELACSGCKSSAQRFDVLGGGLDAL